MSQIPATFRAYVAERGSDERVTRGVRDFPAADLPPGEVEVRVDWSSVNFKDALATIADGKVARINPLIPGIDLAGEVVASADPAFRARVPILAHGYDLGVARHGGYGAYTRLPAGYVVPLPAGLDARAAMAVGTAGFTAAMSVAALERHGLRPGDGPVVVTGASGGVGSVAVAILAGRGHEVWAATGKPDEAERLRALGAAGLVPRDECTATSPRPLESARWAGAVDTVGAATLPWVLRTLRPGRRSRRRGTPAGRSSTRPSCRSSCAGWPCSGWIRRAWRSRHVGRSGAGSRPISGRTASTPAAGSARWTSPTSRGALDAILAGAARGRWVVRVSA